MALWHGAKLKLIMREPLLHFFVLGAVLFALYGWLNPGSLSSPDEIVVDRSLVDSLRTNFQGTWQRMPSDAELQGLIDAWVRTEILYREGMALGLDRNDPQLRQRIVQKMSLMAGALSMPAPTDDQLQMWLDAREQDYQREATYTFRQVFFDPGRHPAPLDGLIAQARSALEQGQGASAVGDATHLPESMAAVTLARIGRTFGDDFAAALAGAAVGSWQGPLPSAFGVHLVYVSEATPAARPSLADVRSAVARDYQAAQRRHSGDAFYDALRERYKVRVDAEAFVLKGPTAADPP